MGNSDGASPRQLGWYPGLMKGEIPSCLGPATFLFIYPCSLPTNMSGRGHTLSHDRERNIFEAVR